jgi:hypothetical protein
MTEPLNPRTIAQYIDHTLLKPEATAAGRHGCNRHAS